ncbi:MAG: type II toxin-antitoxin system RelE/ParE family toxin [Planctomycetes bacterium]|nr:type II toxin-antitoxin system RelE/ParE family toxin [Planctomycetota bacterium]
MSNKQMLIEWEGTSYSDLMSFPIDARHNAGFQLGRLQIGLDPTDWKPVTGLAKGIKGVREIRIWTGEGGYRVVYALKFGDAISVLHCFEKKTRQTEKKDINLIVQRFKAARNRYQPKT